MCHGTGNDFTVPKDEDILMVKMASSKGTAISAFCEGCMPEVIMTFNLLTGKLSKGKFR